MKKDVTTYQMTENAHSGLELELHFMPRFFVGNPGAMAPHVHRFYQIIWFRRGHGVHRVDFVDYPVADNTIFFIAPGQAHSFDGTRDYEGIIIHFNDSFMADEESSESVFLKYDVFNAYDALPYYRVTHEEAARLMTLVSGMNREYALTGAFAHKDYMQYLVRLFLIRVQRNGERSQKAKLYVNSVANRTFVRFRQQLEQHFHTVHTVKSYADMLNISSRALTNYVNQSTHCSPLQVINDRLVLEAKRQLQHSALSIKEIAYDLGFEDPSYFAKFFKRMTGRMPNEFRNHTYQTYIIQTKNNKKMKIAIPTAEGRLFPHFGKAPQVTVYDVEDSHVTAKEVLAAPEHAHGAMPRFLQGLGVTDVVCGGLGAGAVNLLNEMHIAIHGGAPAEEVDKVMNDYLAGTLVYGDATCHHDVCDGHGRHND